MTFQLLRPVHCGPGGALENIIKECSLIHDSGKNAAFRDFRVQFPQVLVVFKREEVAGPCECLLARQSIFSVCAAHGLKL